MVVYWWSSGVTAWLLQCPNCRNQYDYNSEEEVREAVFLHGLCGRV